MPIAKKSYGQHFLKDQSVIEKIIAAADIQSDDLVAEVGPGTGALTSSLMTLASGLILVESDRDLIPELEQKFPGAKIIQADAATVDYDALVSAVPPPVMEGATGEVRSGWIFVSNLPYNAGNAIIMQVLQAKNPPKRLVVMVQKEVGDRMLGRDPGVLAVATQLYAQVEKVCTVPPGAFAPQPKVDSVVLRLTPIASILDREKITALAKIGFGNRRKQLHKNLAEAGIVDSATGKQLLRALGLSELARAEELSLNQWIELSEHLS